MKTSLWFSWLIFAIAAAALCLTISRCEPIEVDWAAILVGTLAILVTALIGWQVYNVVDLKTTSKKLDRAINTSTELNNELNNFKIYVDAEVYCSDANSLYILKRYMDAIEKFIKALQLYAKIEKYEQKEQDIKKGVYSCVANWACCIIYLTDCEHKAFIDQDDKKIYKRIINILESNNRPNFQSLIGVNDDIKGLFDIMKIIDSNTKNGNMYIKREQEEIRRIHERNAYSIENLKNN